MRDSARSRLLKQAASIDPSLPLAARIALLQLLYVGDVLESYLSYLDDDWHRAVIESCIHAVSPTNPKLKEFFSE